MAEIVSTTTVWRCGEFDITIEPRVRFGFGTQRDTVIEGPATIRSGTYDIEFLGAYTYLGGRDTLMRHIVAIGRFCSIASNIVAGQVEHPTDFLSAAPMFVGSPLPGGVSEFQAANRAMVDKAAKKSAESMAARAEKIRIGNDVWIGEGVFIRRGVTIGEGAVVAARSVLTADVPPYAVVGGVPAKVIRYRFPPDIIAALLQLQWWNYGLSALHDVDFTDIEAAIKGITANIDSGRATPYLGPLVQIAEDGNAYPMHFDPDTGALTRA